MSLCRSLLITNQDKTIYNALKRDMVLWYDLKKQGATNESMSKDPRLIDLSGNENHATCNNFAWKGESGIGLYPIIFTYNDDCFTSNEKGNIIISNGSINYSDHTAIFSIPYKTATKNMEEFSIKIDGTFGESSYLKYWYLQENSIQKSINFTSPGIYKLPKSYNLNYDETISGSAYANSISIIGTFTGTVEILPNYENSLVFDGTDDFCKVEGLPIFTPEIGYTVISKRKLLSGTDICVCSKYFKKDFGSSLLFEFKDSFYGESVPKTYSFGNENDVNFPDLISYQTSSKYNNTTISKGSTEDSDKLWLGTIRDDDKRFSVMALYSIILFKRDLTEQEIQWVINNLI